MLSDSGPRNSRPLYDWNFLVGDADHTCNVLSQGLV